MHLFHEPTGGCRRAIRVKTRIASVDEYIASQPETGQRVSSACGASSAKPYPTPKKRSYGIPTYKLDGRSVLYFAG